MSDSNKFIADYRRVSTNSSMLAITKPFIPRPTKDDYNFGEIRRWFSQQANRPNGEIVEISKGAYQSLKEKSLFIVVELRWQISGPDEDVMEIDPDTGGERVKLLGVRNANESSLRLAAKTIPNITRRLTNLFQLWQGR